MIFKGRILVNLIVMSLVTGLVFLSLPPFPPFSFAAGNVYYVAKNGSDSNPGTEAQPFLIIQKVANVAQAGDTVYVKAGTYDERVIPQNSGSPGNLITYQAYPDDRVVMQGFTILKDYIRIKGFEITNTPDHWRDSRGIWLQGDHNEVLENYIHHTRADGILAPWDGAKPDYSLIKGNVITYAKNTAITIEGTNNVIENNDISHPTNLWEGVAAGDADAIRFFGSGHIIRNNYIHDLLEIEAPEAHMDAFQTFDTANNILIEGNYVFNIAHQITMMAGNFRGPVTNITFRNNIFEKNGTYAFIVGGVSYLTIMNNTFIDILHDSVLLDSSPYATIKNNIFYESGGYSTDEASKEGLTADYNLFYPAFSWPPSPPGFLKNEPHGLWNVNPKFIDYANHNFRLQPGSPAIDAGTSDGALTTDKDGNPRYDDPNTPNKGGGSYPYYDIGAYEYQGTGGPSPSDTTPPTVSIFSPPSGSTVSGSVVNITASASDNIGVTKVEFYIDGQLKSNHTTSPYAYSWNTTAYSNGSHTLMVKAYDAAGNSRSASHTVTVSNQTSDTGSGGSSSSPAPSGGGSSGGGTSGGTSGGGGTAPAPAPSGGGSGSGNSGGTPSSGVITGRIIDVASKPVVGATVKVGDTTTTTGLNGEFAIRAPAEVVTAYYTANGYQGQTQVLPVAPNGTVTPPTVVLSGDTGEILGRVINPSGETIPGTVIRINASIMPTNPGGEYRFTQVYPGIYTIYYDAPGYIGQTQIFQILGGIENRPPTVILSPAPDSQIGSSRRARNGARRWRWRRVRRR